MGKQMASESRLSDKSDLNGQKRKFEEEPKLSGTTEIAQTKNGYKRVVHDGYSWWTCLTMGMPVEYRNPHSQPKQSQEHI